MAEKIFIIENMSCNHCVMAVKKELSKLNLDSFQVEIGSAKINYDESKTKNEQIVKAIEEAGYKVRRD
ncbi:MAG: heavy-metal-associated domain-containing protein [Melioribacter sp.]|nr:heavy-metal-associated domain-containing protein [Melioribacter sp.]